MSSKLSETQLDLILGTFLVAGAALQAAAPMGPWLAVFAVVGLGLRAALAQDMGRAQKSSIVTMVVFLVFHILFAPNLGVVRKVGDFLVLLAVPPLFWLASLANRDRMEALRGKLEGSRSDRAALEARLTKMESEAAKLEGESEAWARLFSVTKSIGEVIRESEMVEVVAETVRKHLKSPAHLLLLGAEGSLKIRGVQGLDQDVVSDAAFQPDSPTLASWFSRQREPMLFDDMRQDERFPSCLFPFRSVMVIPLWMRDNPVGMLMAMDDKAGVFSRQDFAKIGILGNQLALGVGKALLYERVEELSITDGLTKLYRHRHFQDRIDQELERDRRYGRPVSFLMMDLDHFKKYNDTYGHPEGDKVLFMVSRLMEETFPRPSVLARYGGEEFAVMLPDTPRERAVEMAESFRRALERKVPPCERAKDPVTVSIGVASFPDDAQVKRDLVARADQALYKAKSAGRNRVVAWKAS